MDTPPELEAAVDDRDDVTITKREYGTEQVIAVDFGPTGAKPSLDVVEGTAIVVVDRAERSSADRSGGDDPPEEDQQFEFDIPAGASDVTVNDGILTITN
ncbi:DUF7127 family protein [Haloterrigena salina]|nr:hypothetical protein [Haloterrigena salina]